MHRPLITTGRLATRMNMAQRDALTTRLQPYLADKSYLAKPPHPLEVELGMGNGLALLQRAQANPATHFLGCEIYLNGLRTLLNHLQQTPAPNLRIHHGDARDLLEKLPAQSISRLLLPFPDPWRKARHGKRRLVQQAFLDAVQRVLVPKGEFWIISDWPDYITHSMEQLALHPHFKTCHATVEAPAWWVKTKYQFKAEKSARPATFIRIA
jgi:tRNA (guanine-N7-)-methyltransferase